MAEQRDIFGGTNPAYMLGRNERPKERQTASAQVQADLLAAQQRAEASERELASERERERIRKESIAPVTEALPTVALERLGAPEEQAQRAQLARQLMAEQQAGARQLAAAQAKQGVRGGAASAQQQQLAQRIAAQRAAQEEAAFLGSRQFNIQQAQKEQFANVASELARRQLMASLRGQELQSQAAKEFGQQQLQAASRGGKVICTELYRQGLMHAQLYAADQDFGVMMRQKEPELMVGYWMLAVPVVKLMHRSEFFTQLVWFVVRPWAQEMAFQMKVTKRGSFIGKCMMKIGFPICRALGKMRYKYAAN